MSLFHSSVKVTKKRTIPGRTADGTMNGGPVYLQTRLLRELSSHVHCVGDNYREDSWQERSCHFDFLCLNVTSHEYVAFSSKKEFDLGLHMKQIYFLHVSDLMFRLNETNAVSIGGINLKWGKNGIPRLKWFPRILQAGNDKKKTFSYYELPPATVMIPFHSMNGANPGHLVWDDFLPMYNLLEMFQMQDYNRFDVLPIRYKLQDGERGLWASCDLRQEKTEQCEAIMNKFWRLLVGLDSPYNFLSNNENAQLKEHVPGQSDMVCARHAVAGIGSLTDHGRHKAHGWEEEDYRIVHNHGRGGLLYAFRNYMLHQLQIDDSSIYHQPERPLQIVFSQKSSDIFIRSMDFEHQIQLVKDNFPNLKVENYTFKEHSLQKQIEVASSTAIYVTLCGGGAVTGMFLPKGASVFIFYAEDGGLNNGRMNYKPALLDWDLFNAMSHLRVHWIPRNTRNEAMDENAFIMLIQHEIDLIESRTFAD